MLEVGMAGRGALATKYQRKKQQLRGIDERGSCSVTPLKRKVSCKEKMKTPGPDDMKGMPHLYKPNRCPVSPFQLKISLAE